MNLSQKIYFVKLHIYYFKNCNSIFNSFIELLLTVVAPIAKTIQLVSDVTVIATPDFKENL